jgi:MFS family permease
MNSANVANTQNLSSASIGGNSGHPSDDTLEVQTGRLTIPQPAKRVWTERLASRQTLGRSEAAAVLGSATVTGVGVLIAVKNGPATIGATAAYCFSAGVLILTGQLRRRASWVMLSAAGILAAFLSFRTSPWLVSLNTIMIALLGISAASYNRAGTLWGPMNAITRRVLRSTLSVPTAVSDGIAAMASLLPTPIEQSAERKASSRSTLRGVVFAAPLLFVMLMLFASADPVFASYVHLPTLETHWFNDLAVVLVGAVLMLGLLRLAKTPVDDPIMTKRAQPREVAIVLGGFVMLYTAFAFTQIVAAVGGATYVKERTGGSYKEYARSGFFQLLLASAITLVLLFVARGSLERREPSGTRALRMLSVLLCALSIVVVLASMQRIALYSQEFGQTMLRVYSSTFAGWLGVVFALVGVAAVIPAKRQWIAPASLALAVAGLIGMNIYNPEAHVAKNNLDRALSTGDLYTVYFSKLSADAVPTIATGLEKLTGQLKIDSTRQVCTFLVKNPALRNDDRPLAFNRSQVAAAASVHRLCDGVQTTVPVSGV